MSHDDMFEQDEALDAALGALGLPEAAVPVATGADILARSAALAPAAAGLAGWKLAALVLGAVGLGFVGGAGALALWRSGPAEAPELLATDSGTAHEPGPNEGPVPAADAAPVGTRDAALAGADAAVVGTRDAALAGPDAASVTARGAPLAGAGAGPVSAGDTALAGADAASVTARDAALAGADAAAAGTRDAALARADAAPVGARDTALAGADAASVTARGAPLAGAGAGPVSAGDTALAGADAASVTARGAPLARADASADSTPSAAGPLGTDGARHPLGANPAHTRRHSSAAGVTHAGGAAEASAEAARPAADPAAHSTATGPPRAPNRPGGLPAGAPAATPTLAQAAAPSAPATSPDHSGAPTGDAAPQRAGTAPPGSAAGIAQATPEPPASTPPATARLAADDASSRAAAPADPTDELDPDEASPPLADDLLRELEAPGRTRAAPRTTLLLGAGGTGVVAPDAPVDGPSAGLLTEVGLSHRLRATAPSSPVVTSVAQLGVLAGHGTSRVAPAMGTRVGWSWGARTTRLDAGWGLTGRYITGELGRDGTQTGEPDLPDTRATERPDGPAGPTGLGASTGPWLGARFGLPGTLRLATGASAELSLGPGPGGRPVPWLGVTIGVELPLGGKGT